MYKLLALVGLILFIHCAASSMGYKNHIKAHGEISEFQLPVDIVAETIFAAILVLWGLLGTRTFSKIHTKDQQRMYDDTETRHDFQSYYVSRGALLHDRLANLPKPPKKQSRHRFLHRILMQFSMDFTLK